MLSYWGVDHGSDVVSKAGAHRALKAVKVAKPGVVPAGAHRAGRSANAAQQARKIKNLPKPTGQPYQGMKAPAGMGERSMYRKTGQIVSPPKPAAPVAASADKPKFGNRMARYAGPAAGGAVGGAGIGYWAGNRRTNRS